MYWKRTVLQVFIASEIPRYIRGITSLPSIVYCVCMFVLLVKIVLLAGCVSSIVVIIPAVFSVGCRAEKMCQTRSFSWRYIQTNTWNSRRKFSTVH